MSGDALRERLEHDAGLDRSADREPAEQPRHRELGQRHEDVDAGVRGEAADHHAEDA